jgi:hypothetical protein
MTTTPTRRVGLSIRHSPGQLLKSVPNAKTTTAATTTTATATKQTTAAAKTTTTTTKTTTAVQKSEPKPRGGRSQLKIPEPIPEDIFAPPLASSDIEEDDDNDDNGGETAGKAEASIEPNEEARLYADSSDEEAPPRGAISATKFTSSNKKGTRQSLRTRSQEIKATSQRPGESDEVEPGTKKRKRLPGTNEKGSPKKNASHLTNSQGFVKKQKVKATFGGRRSINSQESRKPKGLCDSRYQYRSAVINASQSQKNPRCLNFDASQSQKNLHCPYFDLLSNTVLSSRFDRAPSSSYQTLTIFHPLSNHANLVNDCCRFIMATTSTLTRTTTRITTRTPILTPTLTTMVTLRFPINQNSPLRITSLEK